MGQARQPVNVTTSHPMHHHTQGPRIVPPAPEGGGGCLDTHPPSPPPPPPPPSYRTPTKQIPGLETLLVSCHARQRIVKKTDRKYKYCNKQSTHQSRDCDCVAHVGIKGWVLVTVECSGRPPAQVYPPTYPATHPNSNMSAGKMKNTILPRIRHTAHGNQTSQPQTWGCDNMLRGLRMEIPLQ